MNAHPYQAFGPDAFVLGQLVLGTIEAAGAQRFDTVLKQYGLTEIKGDQWYPLQLWLDVFNEIVATSDDPQAELHYLGGKAMEDAALPPGYGDMPFYQVLAAFEDMSSVINHRGKDVGTIHMEMVNKHHVIMQSTTPYPDETVIGAYEMTAKLFLPEGTKYSIYFDPNVQRRDQGGKETHVHIVWE